MPGPWRGILAETAEPAVTAALGQLPHVMDSDAARVMLYAIGLQESRFLHRVQIVAGGGRGPARGLWQFERGGGAHGVLTHDASRFWIRRACERYRVEPEAGALWSAFETNDVLAAVAARLLLFTDPAPLPAVDDVDGAWRYYLRNWRPGRPHPHTFPQLHAAARAFQCS